MLRRDLLALLMIGPLGVLGCGSNNLPPTDRSELPQEVREAEDKMDRDAAKRDEDLKKKAAARRH